MTTDKKASKNKGILEKVNDYLRKEQREFLFDKKDGRDEEEYFNFFKFLFNSPDKLGV